MEHKEIQDIQDILRPHIGEKVFIEHTKQKGLESEVCYDYAVISRLDPAHLLVITAFENSLLSTAIPYSAISLVAKSHLYFHNENEEIIFRNSQVKANTEDKVPKV